MITLQMALHDIFGAVLCVIEVYHKVLQLKNVFLPSGSGNMQPQIVFFNLPDTFKV